MLKAHSRTYSDGSTDVIVVDGKKYAWLTSRDGVVLPPGIRADQKRFRRWVEEIHPRWRPVALALGDAIARIPLAT